MADCAEYFLVAALVSTAVIYTGGVDVAILNQYPLIPHLDPVTEAEADGETFLTCITDGTVVGNTNSNYFFKVEYSPGVTSFTRHRRTTNAADTGQVTTEVYPSTSVTDYDDYRTEIIGVFSCNGTRDGVTRKVSTVKILNSACIKPLSYTHRATVGETLSIKVRTTTWCSVSTIRLSKAGGSPVATTTASTQDADYSLNIPITSLQDDGIYSIDVGSATSDWLRSYIRVIVTACPSNSTGPGCSTPCLCYHGGWCDVSGTCICPPGFTGENCELACPSSDKYGQSCQWSCNDGNPVRPCRKSLICLPDPYGCECANGYKGFDCDTQFRISVDPPSVHITAASQTTATVTCSCHPWTADDCGDHEMTASAPVAGNGVTLTSQSENDRQAVWTFIPPVRLGLIQLQCSVNGMDYIADIEVTGAAPSIAFNPRDVDANLGQSVTVTCGANGDPEPIKDDFTLTKPDNSVIHQASSTNTNATAVFSTFQLSEVTHAVDGQYVCRVHTIAGDAISQPNMIAVKDQPVPLNQPTMSDVGSDFIQVNVITSSEPFSGDGPIEGITVRYRELPDGQWEQVDAPSGQSRVDLTGLTQDTEYNVTVVLTRPGPGGTGGVGPSIVIKTKVPGPSLGLIAGAAGGSAALILVLVAVAIFIFWRRRRGKESSRAPPPSVPISQLPTRRPKEESEEVDAVDIRNPNPTVAEVSPTAAAAAAPPRPVTYGPVPLDQLVAYVKKQHANSDAGFKAEYKALRDGQLHPWDVARQVYNKKKNRYGNIVTWYMLSIVLLNKYLEQKHVVFSYLHSDDHSRVVMGCDPTSDYINASYIKGYKKDKMYIAAQGPNKATIGDLWRMTWQEKSPCIVMVTNLMENNKVKCERYWPDNTQTQLYGDFGVTCMREDIYADFTIRKFHLFQGDNPKIFHELYQYQFTVWPDHGVPTYASPLMALRNRVKEHVTPESGPIIVHCSAGVGRTGTFIMLDMMMEMFKDEEQVDIFNNVNQLREQRINMVQTSDQYIFIYDALLEAIVCGDTAVPSDQFRNKFQILRKQPRGGGPSELMIQFIALRSLTPIVNPKECRDGRAAENRNKNRRSDDLPSDRARPFLMSPGDETGTNYINAAFINGYKQRDVYIATQAPLPNTVLDMWRLVYDYRISSVVMLNDMDDNDPTYPKYWPDPKQSVQHGVFLIQHVGETVDGHLITRTLRLQNTLKDNEAARMVKIFQLTGWPRDEKTPPSPCQAAMITLLSEVERWQQQTGNEPIVVHCIDGVERSGVFCTMGVACERVKVEQVVDVFQAVKTVRACRPSMVNNVVAYDCCHELVIEYLKGFDTYANFG
uniref:protein-tyrosine-phosphatase n=1 Tax=Branchiostoma floridae TaxID=7739 RepID=C3YLU0_BRAFL|eukprot:XP_002602522.1 hypothetical protein BRAFLDRAFT_93828 [Branchiostoma floridae]